MSRQRSETAERTIEDVFYDDGYNPLASPLDLPAPPPGQEYGWIRDSLAGVPDHANFVDARQRGWVALDSSELNDQLRYPNNDALKKPGLIAMKRDIRWRIREQEMADRQARAAMHSVDNSMFQARERGLVIDRPERSTGAPINGTVGRRTQFQPDA